MHILGLNAFHGDASAALFSDGQLAAAMEEERFNRVKHWAGFPALAAKWCLEGSDGAEHVAISRDPKAHLWRKIARRAARPGDWGRLASRTQNTMKVARVAQEVPGTAKTHFVEHHRAH